MVTKNVREPSDKPKTLGDFWVQSSIHIVKEVMSLIYQLVSSSQLAFLNLGLASLVEAECIGGLGRVISFKKSKTSE